MVIFIIRIEILFQNKHDNEKRKNKHEKTLYISLVRNHIWMEINSIYNKLFGIISAVVLFSLFLLVIFHLFYSISAQFAYVIINILWFPSQNLTLPQFQFVAHPKSVYTSLPA